MYRNYKDIRSFHNAKIHALAIKIAGENNERVLIQTEAEALGVEPFNGVSSLSDAHASALHNRLKKVYKSLSADIEQKTNPSGTTKSQPDGTSFIPMTSHQRRTIIKISRYVLNWTTEYAFSMIVESCPALRKQLTGWELNNSRIGRLFLIMSKSDADKVIKRLIKIEKKKQ